MYSAAVPADLEEGVGCWEGPATPMGGWRTLAPSACRAACAGAYALR